MLLTKKEVCCGYIPTHSTIKPARIYLSLNTPQNNHQNKKYVTAFFLPVLPTKFSSVQCIIPQTKTQRKSTPSACAQIRTVYACNFSDWCILWSVEIRAASVYCSPPKTDLSQLVCCNSGAPVLILQNKKNVVHCSCLLQYPKILTSTRNSVNCCSKFASVNHRKNQSKFRNSHTKMKLLRPIYIDFY